MRKIGPNRSRAIFKMLDEGKNPPDSFITFFAKEIQKVGRDSFDDDILAAELNHNTLAATGFISLWIELFCRLPQVCFGEPDSHLPSIHNLSTL